MCIHKVDEKRKRKKGKKYENEVGADRLAREDDDDDDVHGRRGFFMLLLPGEKQEGFGKVLFLEEPFIRFF